MHTHAIFSIPLADPLVIFLVLMTAVFTVPYVCRKLGFPEIVGLILVGVALGPHVLGVLERDRVIELFGSVGILFLMFIAGLEIDGNDFRRYRMRSLWFGFLTFSIPMVLGTAAGLYVLRLEVLAAVLLASMFASHTLLSYPLASRLRITGDEAVGVAVGGTIITDVAALMVLAVVAAAKTGGLGPAMALRMGLSLVALVVVTLGILPRLAGIVYDRLEREGDLLFLFTLVVLFLSGVLAELAGVEPIIGAFLAGIAVGRHIPPISPLANRLEFFGNAIFVPTFLISVGMLVDPRAFVADRTSLIVAVTMSACVLVTKWLAAFVVQKTYRWSRERRTVVFGLSVAQAAATLAAVLVGYRLEIFDEAVLNGTIVMILVTVVASSVAVQSGGHRMARGTGDEEHPAGERRRIVVGVANPDTAARALDLALMLRDEGSETALRAITVLPPAGATPALTEEAQKRLKEMSDRGAAAGAIVDATHRVDDSAARGLSLAAREFLATDIIIGWRDRRSLFDRRSREVMSDLADEAVERIFAARLNAPLGTLTAVEAIFLPNAEMSPDFEGCVAALKLIVRHAKARLVCRAREPVLALLREQLNTTPALSGVDYIESDPLRALATPAIKAERNLLVFVAARRNEPAWSEEVNRVFGALEGKFHNRDALVIIPRAVEEHAVAPAQRGLLRAVARLFAPRRGRAA